MVTQQMIETNVRLIASCMRETKTLEREEDTVYIRLSPSITISNLSKQSHKRSMTIQRLESLKIS